VAGPAASRTLRSLRSLRVGSRLGRYTTCLEQASTLLEPRSWDCCEK
jgi:hypothetical protein